MSKDSTFPDRKTFLNLRLPIWDFMGMESFPLIGCLLGRVIDMMVVGSRTARDEAIRPCTLLGVQTLLIFHFVFLVYIESNGAFANATGTPLDGGPLADLVTVFFVVS